MSETYLHWLRRKVSARARRTILTRIYRDRHPEQQRTTLVAGVARSGTTWLADIIGSQSRSRILFEPFNPYPVGALRASSYIQYRRPQEIDDTLYTFCQQLFSGRIRHRWIDQQVEHLYPENRVVKTVRANLLLKWLVNNFPAVHTVLLVRHPCAVVLSWLKLGWSPDRDLDSFLSQPKLRQDFLATRLPVVEGAVTDEEKIAAIWSISTLVPLQHLEKGDVHLLFYEDLVTQPEAEIPRLFAALKRPYDDSVFAQALQPSATSRRTSAVFTGENSLTKWREGLSVAQIDRIYAVVAAFGLDFIYDTADVPVTRSLLPSARPAASHV